VRDVLEQTNPRVARRQEWLTQIEILLDKEGNFRNIVLHKKSGLDGLDAAAIEAFKAGSPYQNPPQEMVQDDGRIHLYYSISVSAAF
jgi:outer membrane biosynthesis protein TonB